jgi:hypothetical protein
MEGKDGAIVSASPEAGIPGEPVARPRSDVKRLTRALQMALIGLARERLRQTKGGRWSALLGLLLMTGFGLIALVLRADDGPDVALGGLFETAARTIAWAAGAPLGLAIAHDRGRADRAAGIEALAASRGAGRSALEAARTAAAMLQTTLAIGLPLLVLALLGVALAGSLTSALRHLGLAAGLAGFSILAGVSIGGIAAACGRLGAMRGRSLLAAVVLVPWVLTDLAGLRAWSIPGALSAALAFIVRVSSGGGHSL